MHRYIVHVRVPNNVPAEHDFYALLGKFDMLGFSDSKRNRNTEIGEAYFAAISSEKPVTLAELRVEFPEITISRLEKRVA